MKRFAIRVILHILFIMLLNAVFFAGQMQGFCSVMVQYRYLHHTINNPWYTPIPYAIQANNFIETADRRTSIQ